MINTHSHLPDHPFWRFSVRVYENAQVKAALLTLQNEWNLDVNILLFCCWFAQVGKGRIAKTDMQALYLSTSHWQNRIIAALRRTRDSLKRFPAESLGGKIRQAILTEELTAEHIAQMLLVETQIVAPIRSRQPLQQATDALKNLLVYLNLNHVDYNSTLNLQIYQLLSGIFSNVELLVIYDLCQNNLKQNLKPNPANSKQQRLYLD